MPVPFVDLTREYAELETEIQDAVERVLESGWFVLGDEVSSFEEEFARYLNVTTAVGVNSGSDALELALDAVGVGAGDEVITPSHSFISTANAIVANGAEPIFVDIDEQTYCMDVGELDENVTEDTAAIVPVHLYGQPVEMDVVMDVANRYDLAVVEDACQAHGARYHGQRVGTIGDIGCFSFYPVKNLGAYGDGGAIVTDNSEIAERVRVNRNVGQTERYHHDTLGINSRLDEIQAAILREKLPRLDEWNKRRREVAATYNQALSDTELILPDHYNDVSHVYHLYVVRTKNRQTFRSHLESNGISTLIHYPIPIHQQPPYREVSQQSLPVTERITNEIISLPIFPWMLDEEITAVIESIRSFT